MRVLEYSDLDTTRVRPQYEKLKAQLERDDLRSADLKKLTGSDYYRAKLDDANRLLLKLVRHDGERYALALEVIEQHAYEKSRFLNGATVNEDKIPRPQPRELAIEELPPLAYVNPASTRFHLLDKVLSFDDAQEEVYRLAPPVILIGSAGSGKTALALEKLKVAPGDVLYVTQSAFLAQHARDLYYANGYRGEHQNADFLSLRELIETIQVPPGRELRYGEFRGWLARYRTLASRIGDAHKLFEEFRGVLTGLAVDKPWLAREDYLALGVRRCVFLAEERELVYDLFEKYLLWLREAGLYDGNVVAHELLARVSPRYDFVTVDEAQDLTNIQLTLILRTLRQPGQFLLCGDANQVVHPSFFSWANVKTLFFEHEELAPQRQFHILHANYRNAVEVTEAANRLLKIKLARFGSIDRESHYFVTALTANGGEVHLLADRGSAARELDASTRQSARFAVIVLRDEDKTEAAQHFRTPLLFSVQEAKGLEYENIILYNLVARARAEFTHLADGVSSADVEGEIGYGRAKDKRDKSLETHKFFVNALYVAMTRAVRRLYVVESDPGHPLLRLMGLVEATARPTVASQASTREEWQQEARRLELQGKQEQAEAIRIGILHVKPVPWQVIERDRFAEIATTALAPGCVSSKLRQQLFEYAALYEEHDIVERLMHLRYTDIDSVERQVMALRRKHLGAFLSKSPKEVLRLAAEHGVDYRSPLNFTPLMLAAHAGHLELVRTLLELGADPELTDNSGRTALHIAIGCAQSDEQYAATVLPALWPLLAPPSTSLRLDDRLLKIDAHLIEYVLFHLMYALLRFYLCIPAGWGTGGMRAGDLLEAAQRLPPAVLRPDRRRREYLSGALSRNEIDREYPYNRRLFRRVWHGNYVLNPKLALRAGDQWIDVYDAMGLRAMAALGLDRYVAALGLIERANGGRESILGPSRSREQPAPRRDIENAPREIPRSEAKRAPPPATKTNLIGETLDLDLDG